MLRGSGAVLSRTVARLLILSVGAVALLACVSPARARGATTTVEVDLTLKGADPSQARDAIAITTVLDTPAGSIIARLRTENPGSVAYQGDLETLLQPGGTLPADVVANFLLSLPRLPTITITEKQLRLVVEEPGTVMWSSFDQREPARLALTYGSVPSGTALVARLATSGSIHELAPSPVAATATAVTWRVSGPSAGGRIRARVAPSLSSWPGWVAPASNFVAGVLPLLLLLLLVRGAPAAMTATVRTVRRVSRWAVWLAAAAVAASIGEGHVIALESRRSLGRHLTELSVVRGIEVLLPMVAVVLLHVSRPGRRLRRAPALVLPVAATAAAVLPQLPATMPHDPEGAISVVYGGVGLLTFAVIIYLGLRALVEAIVELSPERVRRVLAPAPAELTPPAPGPFSGARQIVAWLRPRLPRWVCVAASVVIAGQALLTVGNLVDGPGVFTHSHRSLHGYSTALTLNLPNFALSFIGPLIGFAVLAAGVGLARLLGQAHDLSFRAATHGSLRPHMATILFAALIIGTGGAIGHFAAPIPLALGALVGLCALAWRSRSIRRWPLARVALAFRERRSPLERAVALVALNRREQTTYDSYAAGSTEDLAYAEARRKIALQRETLLDLHSEVSRSPRRGVRPVDLEHLGLGLGPGSGARGRLLSIGRAGWILVAIPALWGTYLVIKHHAGAFSLHGDAFGILFLISSLTTQAAFWAAAAILLAVLFPVLPTTNGAAKGLILAAAFALAWALPAALLGSTRQLAGSLPLVAAELGLLLALLGALMDSRTMSGHGLYWRHQLDLYRIRGIRSAVLLLSPLLILGATVAQQLATGNTTSAVSSVVKGASNVANAIPAGAGASAPNGG